MLYDINGLHDAEVVEEQHQQGLEYYIIYSIVSAYTTILHAYTCSPNHKLKYQHSFSSYTVTGVLIIDQIFMLQNT